MRGAAAALAGAVLFFLGVLTVASDTDRVSPPPAIPLGLNVDGEPAAVEPSPDEAPAAPAEDRSPAAPDAPGAPPGVDP
ncbi:MAG: hypothetical protein ACRD0S_12535, partial [Acidimicrobiales bacterium]